MRRAINDLTRRELEITQYLACGLSHKEIAQCIQRSVSTVSNTLRGLYEKLKLNKESEVVAYYLCKYHGASVEFDRVGKIRKALGACMLALIMSLQISLDHSDSLYRRCRRGRAEEEIEILIFNEY